MIEPKDCWMRMECGKKECGSFCIKLFKLDYLYNQALLSSSQRQHINLYVDADGSDKDAFHKLKEIELNIEEFVSEGKNIFLRSFNTGNGKTSWALRMIQAYFNKIWHKSDLTCKALFINVPRFLLSLKDNISHEDPYIAHIKQYVLSADLVVWDEIGVKSLTTFEHENLLNLINTRIDMNKSNIYTSNLALDELKEKVGDRLFSRIVNNSTNFELFGKDKRNLKV